ncbi:mechanosensitive ion channel domain-containing protein [Dongia sp.]|uniref:mechanosensitive ion channel domain-containing protein n=1 Tax=Dongia sp. TaxID=1977262 RepID=UPI003753557D
MKAPRLGRILAALVLVGLCWLLPVLQAAAQTIPGVTPPVASKQTTADLENLIKTLDDPKARDVLKKQLQLMLQAQRGSQDEGQVVEERGLGARLLATISHQVESVSNTLVNLVEAIADMPQRAREAAYLLADPQRRAYWMDVVIDLVGVLATAFIAAWGARRLLIGVHGRLARQHPERWLTRLLFLPLIFLLEVLPTLAFAVASSVAAPVFQPNPDATRIISAIVIAQLATMLTAVISSSLLAARAPGLRLFRMSDESAVYAQVWVRRLSVVAFYGYAITQLAEVIGVDPALREVIARLWGLLLAAMSLIVVLQNRAAVARRIAGGPLTDPVNPAPTDEPMATPLPDAEQASGTTQRFKLFRRQLAKFWHILAIAYIVANYLVWSFQIAGGFAFLLRATVLTAILFVVVRLADRALRQVFDRSFALPEDVKRLLPGLEVRANRYLPVLKKTVLVALYVVGAFALLQVWGLDMIGWLSTGSGRPAMAAAFKIVIIILLAGLLSELVNMAIEHYLRDTDAQGRRIYHSGRMRTLLPLLRNAFRITLGVLVLMVVLSEIGLDIAPLLAAAGVVGLAVGFGAQTLVKDIITGVFILLEDTIAVGDVVDLGGHAGVVEGMTIRTIRLRDGAGAVHTVPFGAVTIVQNMTKDFSYATFDIKVDYREDPDKVIAMLKQVGGEIEKEPQFRYGLLGTTEIIGLDTLGDNGYIIKARIKTRAMSQWDVMRAFNLRLKRAFDEEGMLFPGVMAAMPPRTAAKVIYEHAPPPPVAKAVESEAPKTKDQAAAEPTESPDQPVAPANPAGRTIVPPR